MADPDDDPLEAICANTSRPRSRSLTLCHEA